MPCATWVQTPIDPRKTVAATAGVPVGSPMTVPASAAAPSAVALPPSPGAESPPVPASPSFAASTAPVSAVVTAASAGGAPGLALLEPQAAQPVAASRTAVRSADAWRAATMARAWTSWGRASNEAVGRHATS